MLDSDLYLVGKQIPVDECLPEEYVENAAPCALCKRMIINAGIKRVIVRDTLTKYRILDVEDWKTRDKLIGGY